MLAYSTISQLGLMFIALGVGAYWAALFHVVTHAFFKAQLFLCAGSVIHALDGEQDIRFMGGLRRQMPHTFRTMFIATLALAGWPGLAGFFSKDAILVSAWAASPALFGVGLLTAFLTAFYMGRLLFLTFFGPYRGDVEIEESPKRMIIPLWVLSVGSIGAGWFGSPFAHWLGATPVAHSWGVMPASAAVAVGGLALAFHFYLNRPGLADQVESAAAPVAKLLRARWYFDDLYEWAVVRGFARGGGSALATLDQTIVDGGVDGLGWLTRRTGAISRWADTWIVDGAVNLTALTVKLASFPVRFIQTGFAQSYALVIVMSLAALAGWYILRSA